MRAPSLARRRPRYADVTATLALVVALGGTAYGVAEVASPNSVNTAAIQNQAVTAPKLANEAVTAAKLAPASVTSAKLAAKSVSARQVVSKSLKLSDLRGIIDGGTITITVPAHGCSKINFGVSGAALNSTPILSFPSSSKPPKNLVFGPLEVISPTLITAQACNFAATALTKASFGVQVITLY